MHVILTAHYKQALSDFSDQIRTLNQCRMHGQLKDGRTFTIRHFENHERLHGLTVDSYEIHPSCYAHEGDARLETALAILDYRKRL